MIANRRQLKLGCVFEARALSQLDVVISKQDQEAASGPAKPGFLDCIYHVSGILTGQTLIQYRLINLLNEFKPLWQEKTGNRKDSASRWVFGSSEFLLTSINKD